MQQQIPNNTGVVKDEISLKEVILSVQAWWKYMLSKWKVIVLAGVIGGVLGLVYSLVKRAKYKAEASFVLDVAKSDGSVASLAAKFGLGSAGSGDGLFADEDNIISFLKSRTIVAQTLTTYVDLDNGHELLIERYLALKNMRSKWKDELKQLVFQPYPEQNSLLADSILSAMHKMILKDNLQVDKPNKDGNIISVVTTSTDPLFSKVFTDKLIENATRFYSATVTKKSAENLTILQHQADSVKKLLNLAISGVASSSDAFPNLNPAYQRLKVPAQKNVVDIEMNKAILEQLVTNLELAKVDFRKESPLIQIIDSPVLPLEKIKVGKLKGIIFGGILFSLLIVIFLSIRRYIKNIISNS